MHVNGVANTEAFDIDVVAESGSIAPLLPKGMGFIQKDPISLF